MIPLGWVFSAWSFVRKHGRLIVGSIMISAVVVLVAGGYVYGYIEHRNAEALERELAAERTASEVYQRNLATAVEANAEWTAAAARWNAAVASWAEERTDYLGKLAELRKKRDDELAARQAVERTLAEQIDAAATCEEAVDQFVAALAGGAP